MQKITLNHKEALIVDVLGKIQSQGAEMKGKQIVLIKSS